MGKKGQRSRPEEDSAGTGADPLGKLITRYQANLAAALLVTAVAGAIGLGLIGYAITRQPIALLWMLAGAGVVVSGLSVLAMSLWNMRKCLEVRKKGLRFVDAGDVMEMFWDDIADIAVQRTDDTSLGVVAKRTRSSDAVTPSGPLTRTDWDITIRARDGRKIRLRPSFLKIVPNVQELVSRLRLRAGL